MTDANPATTDTGDLGLPPCYQVGYVVHDVDATVARLDPLFGPFTVFESPITPMYKGVETPVTLKVAVGHSGELEMEFIEVLSGEAPHTAWLERHGESIMHVAFRVPDADATLAQLAEHGFETEWRGDVAGTPIVFAYARSSEDAGAHYLEIVSGF